jgi:hypothetical protein
MHILYLVWIKNGSLPNVVPVPPEKRIKYIVGYILTIGVI